MKQEREEVTFGGQAQSSKHQGCTSGDSHPDDESSVQTSQEVKGKLRAGSTSGNGGTQFSESSAEVPDSALPSNITIPAALRRNMPAKLERLIAQLKGKSTEEIKEVIVKEIEHVRM